MLAAVRLVLAITHGLVRSQQTRRSAMFVLLIVALVMLFSGATFLSDLLLEHPLAFLLFWAVCAWLTLCAVLLAVFDLLVVRAQARKERELLKTKIFGAQAHDDV